MKCHPWAALIATGSAIFRLSLVLQAADAFSSTFVRQEASTKPEVPQSQLGSAPQIVDERDTQLRNLRYDSVSKVVILQKSVPLDLVKLWREDACALYNTGFGGIVGIAQATLPRQDGIVRKGVHQIWIQTPHTAPLQAFVGNIDGRRSLIGFVENLRLAIVASTDVEVAPELVELSYLIYGETGAYYDRHIDAIRNGTHQRRFSFIIYLGGVNDNDGPCMNPWNIERDGGALRIYDGESSQILCDVVPESGTLVVFSSTSVWHEVLPVLRKRVCVVGWFNSDL